MDENEIDDEVCPLCGTAYEDGEEPGSPCAYCREPDEAERCPDCGEPYADGEEPGDACVFCCEADAEGGEVEDPSLLDEILDEDWDDGDDEDW